MSVFIDSIFRLNYRDLPFILLTRPLDADGFPSSSKILGKYLTSLIQGKFKECLEIDQLTKTIGMWKNSELEKMSEMSMDSMCQLYSGFQKYDNRWNEIFMMPLTKDLIELKVWFPRAGPD